MPRTSPREPALDPVEALRLVYVADRVAAADTERLGSLFEGGVTAVWLRDPTAVGADLYDAARRLRPFTRAAGVALLIGDRVDVALAAGADGVQLGHRAPPVGALRPVYRGLIGASCHDARALARAEEEGADYVVLSPVFAVPGKGPPLGPEGFGRLRRTVRLPVVALGGLDARRAPAVRAAGADGLALLRALRDAERPRETARALVAANAPDG